MYVEREGERESIYMYMCTLLSFSIQCNIYYVYIFCVLTVKADQQSKASTSQAPSATSGGEAMDITTPGDMAKILVSKLS